jgi:membrane protein implicated in regulation of membrane protease activity
MGRLLALLLFLVLVVLVMLFFRHLRDRARQDTSERVQQTIEESRQLDDLIERERQRGSIFSEKRK